MIAACGEQHAVHQYTNNPDAAVPSRFHSAHLPMAVGRLRFHHPSIKSHKTWDSAKAIAWVQARAIGARTRTGEVIWILTTLSTAQLPTIGAMALYRLRWQIELLFKRLKSQLHLDTLPSRKGQTAKNWMLARLIAAALAQRLVQPSGPLSPWGYDLRGQSVHA